MAGVLFPIFTSEFLKDINTVIFHIIYDKGIFIQKIWQLRI